MVKVPSLPKAFAGLLEWLHWDAVCSHSTSAAKVLLGPELEAASSANIHKKGG